MGRPTLRETTSGASAERLLVPLPASDMPHTTTSVVSSASRTSRTSAGGRAAPAVRIRPGRKPGPSASSRTRVTRSCSWAGTATTTLGRSRRASSRNRPTSHPDSSTWRPARKSAEYADWRPKQWVRGHAVIRVPA